MNGKQTQKKMYHGHLTVKISHQWRKRNQISQKNGKRIADLLLEITTLKIENIGLLEVTLTMIQETGFHHHLKEKGRLHLRAHTKGLMAHLMNGDLLWMLIEGETCMDPHKGWEDQARVMSDFLPLIGKGLLIETLIERLGTMMEEVLLLLEGHLQNLEVPHSQTLMVEDLGGEWDQEVEELEVATPLFIEEDLWMKNFHLMIRTIVDQMTDFLPEVHGMVVEGGIEAVGEVLEVTLQDVVECTMDLEAHPLLVTWMIETLITDLQNS